MGPYGDEKLGFYKIAPHYYYPGWWGACSMYGLYVNIKEWKKLPKEYQAALEAACYEANTDMMAEYDFKNPRALQRLVKNGVKLQRKNKKQVSMHHASRKQGIFWARSPETVKTSAQIIKAAKAAFI